MSRREFPEKLAVVSYEQGLGQGQANRRVLPDRLPELLGGARGCGVRITVVQSHAGGRIDQQRQRRQAGPSHAQRESAKHHQQHGEASEPQQNQRRPLRPRQRPPVLPIDGDDSDDRCDQKQQIHPVRFRSHPQRLGRQLPFRSLSGTGRRQSEIPFVKSHKRRRPQISSSKRRPVSPRQARPSLTLGRLGGGSVEQPSPDRLNRSRTTTPASTAAARPER